MVQGSQYRQYYFGGSWADAQNLPQWSTGTTAILQPAWLLEGGDAYQVLVKHLAVAEDDEPRYRQYFADGTWLDHESAPQWDESTVGMVRFDALGLGDGTFERILGDLT